jgi:RNA polymerase sigma-70 factor, ECF subfamily
MKGSDPSTPRDGEVLKSNSTSTTLIDDIKQGDRDKWELLMRLYRPLVLYWCRGKVKRQEDTEDLVQEVFTTIFQTIGEFTKQPHRGAFRAWLKQITRYKILEYWKKAGNQPAGAGGSEAQERLAEVLDPFADDSSADEDASERCILLRSAKELIRPEFERNTWEAAMRTAEDGQPAADVADALGISPAAVYTAKSRVLTRLRQVMDDLLE